MTPASISDPSTTRIPVTTATSIVAPTRKPKASRAFSREQVVTLSALLVGYMGYYLCRQNLAVAFTAMRSPMQLTEMDLGWWVTLGTIAYAIGKFVSGPLSDHFGGRSAFLVGAIGSALATLGFGASTGMVAFATCWVINRAFQSVGWAGLVAVVARRFSAEQQGRAIGIVALSYQAGGVLATMFAAALLSYGHDWRAVFFGPALTLIAVALWVAALVPKEPRAPASAPIKAEATSYRSAARQLLLKPIFWAACLLSLVLTLLREVFTVWTPVYFTALGASASWAAVKSIWFPVFGCIGTLVASGLSDRVGPRHRFSVMAVFLIGLGASLLLLASVHSISQSLSVDVTWVAMLATGLVGFFLLGPYTMVGGGIVALDFGGARAAATAAGVLDGVGYLAASLAGVGVASAIQRVGWAQSFVALIGFVVVALMGCVAITLRLAQQERHSSRAQASQATLPV